MSKDLYDGVSSDIINKLMEEDEEKRAKSLSGKIDCAYKAHKARQKLRADTETNLTAAMQRRAAEVVLLEPDDAKARMAAQDAKALSEAAKVVNDNRTWAVRAAVPVVAGALGAAALSGIQAVTRTAAVGPAKDWFSATAKNMAAKVFKKKG